VEVKLKLMTREDHEKVERLLNQFYVVTYNQENFFFDGARQELSSNQHIMRIRFYDKDGKAILTVKARLRQSVRWTSQMACGCRVEL